jgi:hypothetical protein
MAIEIRELIIKTEITATERPGLSEIKEKQFEKMKKQLLQEVKRMLSEVSKRNKNTR